MSYLVWWIDNFGKQHTRHCADWNEGYGIAKYRVRVFPCSRFAVVESGEVVECYEFERGNMARRPKARR